MTTDDRVRVFGVTVHDSTGRITALGVYRNFFEATAEFEAVDPTTSYAHEVRLYKKDIAPGDGVDEAAFIRYAEGYLRKHMVMWDEIYTRKAPTLEERLNKTIEEKFFSTDTVFRNEDMSGCAVVRHQGSLCFVTSDGDVIEYHRA